MYGLPEQTETSFVLIYTHQSEVILNYKKNKGTTIFFIQYCGKGALFALPITPLTLLAPRRGFLRKGKEKDGFERNGVRYWGEFSNYKYNHMPTKSEQNKIEK